MDFEDFFESPVLVAVGLTAAAFSPPVRRVARRGAVYGVAGALWAGDAVSSAARGVGRGAQQAASTAGGVAASASERVKSRTPSANGS